MEPYLYPKMNLYRRVVQAKLFIDAHYGQTINVDNIAGEASFSKYHFIRLFKKIYGHTPHQYLTRVRVYHARLMLQKGDGVEDVCYSIGFDSVSTFSGLFKRVVGVSPSSFRQQQMEQKTDAAARPHRYIPACHIPSFMPAAQKEQ